MLHKHKNNDTYKVRWSEIFKGKKEKVEKVKPKKFKTNHGWIPAKDRKVYDSGEDTK